MYNRSLMVALDVISDAKRTRMGRVVQNGASVGMMPFAILKMVNADAEMVLLVVYARRLAPRDGMEKTAITFVDALQIIRNRVTMLMEDVTAYQV